MYGQKSNLRSKVFINTLYTKSNLMIYQKFCYQFVR